MATKRDKWVPGEYSYIWGKHFISGKPSKSPNDPDYVPSVFCFSSTTSVRQQIQAQNRKDRQKGRSERRMSLQIHEEESKASSCAC